MKTPAAEILFSQQSKSETCSRLSAPKWMIPCWWPSTLLTGAGDIVSLGWVKTPAKSRHHNFSADQVQVPWLFQISWEVFEISWENAFLTKSFIDMSAISTCLQYFSSLGFHRTDRTDISQKKYGFSQFAQLTCTKKSIWVFHGFSTLLRSGGRGPATWPITMSLSGASASTVWTPTPAATSRTSSPSTTAPHLGVG